MSGHKRSRSEGSTATVAIAVTAAVRPVGGGEGATRPLRREREVSPPHLARPRKGELL